MASRLTKNVRKKLFSYFNPTCAKSAKIAYMLQDKSSQIFVGQLEVANSIRFLIQN